MPTIGTIDTSGVFDTAPGLGGSILGGAPSSPLSPQAGSMLNRPSRAGFGGGSTMQAINSMLDATLRKRHPELFDFNGAVAAGSSLPTSLGGDWAGTDRWNAQIAAASSKYGVPANLIKAVMKLESGGQDLPPNGAGALGPMQVVGGIWGNLGYDLSDPAQNILAGAAILQQNHDQYYGWATANGVDPWRAAVYAYYAGNPYDLSAADNPAQGGSGMSTGAYGDQIWNDYRHLNQFTGTGTGHGSHAPGPPDAFGTMFKGAQTPVSYEFGIESDLGLYGYGTDYGLDGTQHTGLDLAVPYGTNFYAPMSGVVNCAGTGNGQDAQGGGCAAFRDLQGGGAGRVEVLLDNGVDLIFGHSSAAALAPGMRFDAGALLGASGGENGAHVHLEARVKDQSTPSGWRIVDPRTVLGGAYGGGAAPAVAQNPYYAHWAGNRGGAAAPAGASAYYLNWIGNR